MKAFRAILFSVFLVGSLATLAQAQTLQVAVGSMSLSSSVNNPAPGQSVTITAESYTADLNASRMSWTVAGKSIGQGIGLTSVTVTAPELGKRITVSASAVTPSGAVLNESITVSSGFIDLIMESSGYVPPFFLGKINPSYQNTVTLIAVPHLANSSGTEYDPSTLVYKWKQNGSVIQNQSGYGKQSISLEGGIVPRPYTVNVTVTTRDNSAEAEGYISVYPGSPSISFYSDDSLYGPLYNKALGGTVRIGSRKEADVLAVPYGFDRATNGSNLSLSWVINGVKHSELNTSNSVALRAPQGQAGSSDITLGITNTKQILQGAQAGFSVLFSATGDQSTTTPINF